MVSTIRRARGLFSLLPLCGGCALVADFGFEGGAGGGVTATGTGSGTPTTGTATGSPTGSSAGTSAGGSSSSSETGSVTVTGSGSGGDGGGGAAPPCNGVDLTSDEQNCGTCEFACGSTECIDGRCGEVLELGDGFDITSLRIDGDLLYLVQRTAQGGQMADFVGLVRTVPLDFTDGSVPGLDFPIANAIGGLERGTNGTRHVYFTGQVSLDPGETSDPYVLVPVYACGPDGCDTVYVTGTGGQIQSMHPVGGSLYQLLLSGWALASVPIDLASGLPGSSPVPHVTTYSNPGSINDGVLVLHDTPDPSRLYWSSYCALGETDCCIYRVDIGALGGSPPATCWSGPFEARGFVVSPEGVVYAQEAANRVLKIEGDLPTMVEFATNVDTPRGLDADFFYAADATTGAIRALARDGGVEVARTDAPLGNTSALETSHPDYVFYAEGNRLHRWPKPRSR